MDEKKKRKETIKEAKIKLTETLENTWMMKHGRSHLIEFD